MYNSIPLAFAKLSFTFALILMCLSDIMGQGLTLENQRGKQVSFEPGSEIWLFGTKRKDYDNFEMLGKFDGLQDSIIMFRYLELNTHTAIGQKHENYQTIKLRSYEGALNTAVPLSHIHAVAVHRKSASLQSFGGVLMFAGGFTAMVLAPAWGALSSSEGRFTQTVPGRLSIFGSAAFVTGLSIMLTSDKPKKYTVHHGPDAPRKSWRFATTN